MKKWLLKIYSESKKKRGKECHAQTKKKLKSGGQTQKAVQKQQAKEKSKSSGQLNELSVGSEGKKTV